MVAGNIEKMLLQEGYYKADVSGTECKITGYLKQTGNARMAQIFVVDNSVSARADADFLENLIKDTEQLLFSKGAAKVDRFCIVPTNDSGIETSFGKEGSLVKNYSDVSMDYWLVDVQKNNIMIFEDEPEDFHGIYNCLQAVLDGSYVYRNVNRNTEDKKVKKPVITGIIIAFNVLMFLYTEMTGSSMDIDHMYNLGALNATAVIHKNEYYRLFAAMFLHFGVSHLLSNMFMLAVLGNVCENVLGRFKFLFIYLSGGIVAGLISCVRELRLGETDVVGAGASGAVYAILGSYIVIFLIQGISVSRKLEPDERKAFLLSSVMRIVIVVALTLSVTLYDKSVDVTAHMAGLIFGYFATRVWYMLNYYMKRHTFKY